MFAPNPDSVADLLSSKYISQYCQIALLTVLTYDISITMEAELRLLVSIKPFVGIPNFLSPMTKISLQGSFSKWSELLADWATFILIEYVLLIRVLALYSRAKALSVNQTICSKWSELLADWATFILIEYVLLMRVLALYSRGKTTTLCLRALFALEATYTLALLVYVVVYEKVGVLHISDGLSLCGGVGDIKVIPKTYAAAWVPPMMYDLILMTLSLYKAVQFWRESPGSTAVDLVKVLIQDQAMYFVLLIVNTSAQILSEVLKSSTLTDFLGVLGNPLMLCVLGSHLVVNMKEAGEKGENGGSNRSIDTVSDIQFS
ncbi:hypothetical protein A7U60_g464 [Sanghuangporus baumii]|uniref:Uncharacterized protein n=1 Tax=Sanghuangporus baumii TaxID=108892 RepID=A0A9Q5I5P1_SANBA|nr:hypothetical protein A7U60_g464 [Sanghuangporus baumii]